MRNKQIYSFGLICAVIFLLSACASLRTARDPLTDVPAVDEGTVILSISLNTGETLPFDEISVGRFSESEKTGFFHDLFPLRAVAPSLSHNTSLFVGLLPEGKYRISSLKSYASQKKLVLNETQKKVLGNFRVEAGQTTDLGRLVLTAVNFKVVLGRSEVVNSNSTLIKEFASSYAKLLERPPHLGWSTPKSEKDNAEAFARAHPQGLTGFSETETGEVLAGTRMGLVLSRNLEGQWGILASTGRPEAILWTVPYRKAKNVAVAVGELGTFFAVDESGEIHPIDTGNLPSGNLFFVDRSGKTGEWIVGLRTAGKAQLYISPSLQDPQWKLMRGNSVEADFWSGSRGAWAWSRSGGVGYAATVGGVVACYDYSDAQWTENVVPNDDVVADVARSVDQTTVGILTSTPMGFGGVFAGTYISEDCGSNWIEISSPYKVKMVPPLKLDSGTLLVTGGAFGDAGIYASTDGGNTWSKRTDDVKATQAIWALPSAGLFAVSRGQYGVETVYHSGDEGKTWNLELSSIDREVVESQ